VVPANGVGGLRAAPVVGRIVPFRDRHDAGRRLGVALQALDLDQPVVLGLARGGVVVAAEVAEVLHAPLDVLLVRKLGYPLQPELALGAVGESGVRVLNGPLIARLGVPDAVIEEVTALEMEDLQRRREIYRVDRRMVAVARRTVVVVDDGLATGATARAAVAVVRGLEAGKVVLAVPVGAPEALDTLSSEADDVVCLEVSEDFIGISQWYEHFTQVADEQVRALLPGDEA